MTSGDAGGVHRTGKSGASVLLRVIRSLVGGVESGVSANGAGGSDELNFGVCSCRT